MLLYTVNLSLNRFHLNFTKHFCPSSWEFRYTTALGEETQKFIARSCEGHKQERSGPNRTKNLLWMDEWKWQRWSGLISIQGEHRSEIERESQWPVISVHIEITALFRVNNILWLPEEERSLEQTGQGNHVSELLQSPVTGSECLCPQGNMYWWSSCCIQISNRLECYHPFSHKAPLN